MVPYCRTAVVSRCRSEGDAELQRATLRALAPPGRFHSAAASAPRLTALFTQAGQFAQSNLRFLRKWQILVLRELLPEFSGVS